LDQASQPCDDLQKRVRVTLDIEIEVINLIEELKTDLGLNSRGTVINILLKELLLPILLRKIGLPARYYAKNYYNSDIVGESQILVTEEVDNETAAKQKLVDAIKKIRRELGIEANEAPE